MRNFWIVTVFILTQPTWAITKALTREEVAAKEVAQVEKVLREQIAGFKKGNEQLDVTQAKTIVQLQDDLSSANYHSWKANRFDRSAHSIVQIGTKYYLHYQQGRMFSVSDYYVEIPESTLNLAALEKYRSASDDYLEALLKIETKDFLISVNAIFEAKDMAAMNQQIKESIESADVDYRKELTKVRLKMEKGNLVWYNGWTRWSSPTVIVKNYDQLQKNEALRFKPASYSTEEMKPIAVSVDFFNYWTKLKPGETRVDRITIVYGSDNQLKTNDFNIYSPQDIRVPNVRNLQSIENTSGTSVTNSWDFMAGKSQVNGITKNYFAEEAKPENDDARDNANKPTLLSR
jgi:hypothetical protein